LIVNVVESNYSLLNLSFEGLLVDLNKNFTLAPIFREIAMRVAWYIFLIN